MLGALDVFPTPRQMTETDRVQKSSNCECQIPLESTGTDLVRVKILTVASMKSTVFFTVTACCLGNAKRLSHESY
jgi:hypothetical protein